MRGKKEGRTVGEKKCIVRKYFITFLGLGSESPRTHLSSCVLFRYNTKLYIVVRGDSEPIPLSETITNLNTHNNLWMITTKKPISTFPQFWHKMIHYFARFFFFKLSRNYELRSRTKKIIIKQKQKQKPTTSFSFLFLQNVDTICRRSGYRKQNIYFVWPYYCTNEKQWVELHDGHFGDKF